MLGQWVRHQRGHRGRLGPASSSNDQYRSILGASAITQPSHRSQRASRLRPARLILDAELRAVVQAKLELEWSPVQIAM